MGHEMLIWGMIEGALYHSGDEYSLLHQKNMEIISGLPGTADADSWPWLNKTWFAAPGPRRIGTYRNFVIHLGGSIKDAPFDTPSATHLWISKFEVIIRQLFWFQACVVFEGDFLEPIMYRWTATQEAIDKRWLSEPLPTDEWHLETIHIGRSTLGWIGAENESH